MFRTFLKSQSSIKCYLVVKESGVTQLKLLRNFSTSYKLRGDRKYDYDLLVLGGGSGGLACAKEASDLGARVIVLDYVTPTPKGNKWGLGGTCVNVGCIPKKLMHQTALLGQAIRDARSYGWKTSEAHLDWKDMQQAVIGYVRSLNWGHRVQLKDKKCDYLNAYGSFIDNHTVRATMDKGKEKVVTADKIVVAVGERPKYLDIPGSREHCITSDDVFHLTHPPGNTLIVGASYVALETAGFLAGMRYPVTVMMRSIPLRGFDQQCAKFVTEHLERENVKIIRRAVPTRVKRDGKKLSVYWKHKDGSSDYDEFDTVMQAVGRKAQTETLALVKAGVMVDKDTNKIIGDHSEAERSSQHNIYAIGDVLLGRPELTPVAIKAGRLLAGRLFGNSNEQMDYNAVATTVFTPLEYSCVGLSEDSALKQFGKDNIEVFHSFYKPLEWVLPERDVTSCYIKAVCKASAPHPVLGLHFLGPNAGEVMQGFAAALRLGLTRETLHQTVGIHPTTAEEIVKLHITKRSGKDPTVTGC